MGAPRFDPTALFRALEKAREERGISWSQLATESGVAVSTLKRARSGGSMEADGVLAIVRVLGRAPETFAEGAPLPVEPVKEGRFDTQALYTPLDAKRRARALSWAEASREIGASSGSLQRLARGGRINVDLMLACTWWLGRQANDFVDPAFQHPRENRRGRGPV